jgi:hypothetical protein
MPKNGACILSDVQALGLTQITSPAPSATARAASAWHA